MTLQRGDFVELTVDGRSVEAMVTLVLDNSQRIIVMFDATLGGYAGMMTLARYDGQWITAEGMRVAIRLTEAMVEKARRAVAQGAGHDCDEWRDTPDHRCALCGRPNGGDVRRKIGA